MVSSVGEICIIACCNNLLIFLEDANNPGVDVISFVFLIVKLINVKVKSPPIEEYCPFHICSQEKQVNSRNTQSLTLFIVSV